MSVVVTSSHQSPHLTPGQTGVSIEYLGWLTVALHAPVVDRRLCHQGYHVLGDPLPEDHVVDHRVGFHLGLHLNVEDLESLLRCKKGVRREYVRRFSSIPLCSILYYVIIKMEQIGQLVLGQYVRVYDINYLDK